MCDPGLLMRFYAIGRTWLETEGQTMLPVRLKEEESQLLD